MTRFNELVKENGQSFYGVFNDFDKTAINDWLKENVINHLYDEAPKYIGPKHRMGERVANFLSPNTKYVKRVISECKNELVRGELQGFEEDGPHFKCWNDMKIRSEWVLQTLNDISAE